MSKKLLLNLFTLAAFLTFIPSLSQAQKSKKATTTTRSSYESTSIEDFGDSDSVLPTFDKTIELDLNATSAHFVSAAGTSSFVLNLSAYYFYSRQIEIGAAIGLSSSAGTSHMGIYGLGLYNFDTRVEQSFFAGGGLGFADAGYAGAGAGTDKKMSLVAFAGKRFPLWSRLMLSPVLRFEKIADVDPIISIIPFNVTIIL